MREILKSSTGGTNTDLAENVLVTLSQKEPPEGYSRLVKKFPNCTFNFYALEEWDGLWHFGIPDDSPRLSELLRQATVLLVDWTLPNIEQVPNLKIVQLSISGFDRVVKQPLYTDTGITFCTSNGIYSTKIAEHVFLTLLSIRNSFDQLLSQQHSRIWDDIAYPRPKDLSGTTIGILGYGSIGRQVARIASGLGMKIHAYTASPRPTPASRADRGYILPGTGDRNGQLPDAWFSGTDKPSLHTFLSGVDVLVCSLPLTDLTRHMLSTAEFEILGRRKAYVVNVSRGGIIDHDALTKALKAGLLAGASLDVTEPEPLPTDSELWTMRDVVITPHISGTGRGYVARVVDLLEANLERLSAGESMFNVVKRGRGY
ncbi:hypothetical protein C7212DRAFT_286555 [Tuber magnatum]|uniref:D-isomer specific 2-hydroxyacid dehydrogenase NAD-binding domain-containing protein n=1 Tax=Tuber magnatum TaxID=42249 RepID=A0A317SEU5_9PEZI|nr:hypothetical protein C7212DRAFT_286555 [Tuber magnatum]